MADKIQYGTSKRYGVGWKYNQLVATGNTTEFGIFDKTTGLPTAISTTPDSPTAISVVDDTPSTPTYVKD